MFSTMDAPEVPPEVPPEVRRKCEWFGGIFALVTWARRPKSRQNLPQVVIFLVDTQTCYWGKNIGNYTTKIFSTYTMNPRTPSRTPREKIKETHTHHECSSEPRRRDDRPRTIDDSIDRHDNENELIRKSSTTNSEQVATSNTATHMIRQRR